MPDATRLKTLAVALALALAACAGLDRLRFSESELNALLQKQLPLQRRLLEVFDVTLPAVRLRLLPDRNRLSVAMDLVARERLLGAAWQGQLELDAALRWEARDQTLRLAQVKVLDFRLAGDAAAARGAAERVAAAVAERMLEDFTVHRLSPERAAQLQRLGLVLSAPVVTPRGLEIGVVPAAR